MADFQYYLNRTGPRGPQGYKGDKGDDGKTPVPRTGTNTPTETTVIFDTGDGNPYETPNLKYPIEDRGGNMVMLDRANETQYYGTPAQATDNSYGVVKLATPESVLDDPLDSDVVTYELFDDNNQTIKTVTDGLAGDITQLNTDLDAEVTNRTNADTQLTTKINTDVSNEATARSNADTALNNRIDGLDASKANKSDVYTKTQTDSLLNSKSNVGHTHNYNEITNKPSIGNGTITFRQGNTTIGTITTNQLSNSTLTFADPTGITPGTGLDLNSSTNTLSVKIDNDTLGFNSNGEIEVQNAGTAYSSGDGIDINNDTISAKVDGSTINFDNNGNLIANIPDVSNFVTNSSLANTLGNYPTKTSQQNIINYELATWDDFSYSDKEFSYAKFPFVGSDECPFYYNEPTGDISATSTGFRFNNNCVKYSIGTYEITPGPTKVRFKAKQGDRINITSAESSPIIRYDGDTYVPTYDGIIDDGHTCISDDYFAATLDYISADTLGTEYDYQIEVLQDCLIYEIEAQKTRVASPEGTYSFEYIMANNNPAIEFVVPLDLGGHTKAIFNPDIAGDGLKINSVNKDRIEANVDGTTIGINSTGQLTYIGTTGDVLPSQTGNSGKFLTTNGSAASWATMPSVTPSNMVTTDTSQTITGQKIFDTGSLKTKNILFNESGYSYGLRIDSGNLKYGQSSGDYSYLSPGGMGAHNDYSDNSISTNGWWMGTGYNTAFMQRIGMSGSGYSYLANNQARKFYNPSYSNATSSFTPDSSTPFFITSDLLDGTTIAYNSNTDKVSAVNPVQSTTVHNIVQLTQSEYDTLVNNNNVDGNTFYIITST